MLGKLLIYSTLFTSIPVKRGDFATGTSHPDSAEIVWLSNFDIVQAGGLSDVMPDSVIDILRNSGVRYFLSYEWMPAGYHYTDGSTDDPFMQWVYAGRYTLTLNPEGPFPHCSSWGWCEDYYYDLALDSLVVKRIGYLLYSTDTAGYNGLFFDWGGGDYIQYDEYSAIRDTYNTRHPSFPYQEAVGRFYQSLKDSGPDKIIMTNQGFRNARYVLPHVDYDMTESYAVTDDYFGDSLYVENMGYVGVPHTVYYPVSTDYPDGSIDDQIYYLRLLKEYADSFAGTFFKGFVYMNYAAPSFVQTGDTQNGFPVYRMIEPKNAIYFGYAIPKLMNYIVYTEVPFNHELERDSIYFYDLGEPLGSQIEEPYPHVYVRYYENGLVVAGEWQDTTVVNLSSPYILSGTQVYDPYEGIWFETSEHELSFVIRPVYDSLLGRMAPSGRVLLYNTTSLLKEITKPYGFIPVEYTPDGIRIKENAVLYTVDGKRIMKIKKNSILKRGFIPEGVYILKNRTAGAKIIMW